MNDRPALLDELFDDLQVPNATTPEELLVVANDATRESRIRLSAWKQLRVGGRLPPPALAGHVLAVVLEVALDEGLDVLAAYDDGSARYVNHGGRIVVYDASVASVDTRVRAVLDGAAKIFPRIGLWTEPRRPPPGRGNLRMSFLAPSGLAFGEGPIAQLARDPMAGPLFAASTLLMKALVDLADRSADI